MKQRLVAVAMGLMLAGGILMGAASTASAEASPKACFGQDRAAWIHANSGAEWGEIARVRAGDNAAINAAYKASCLP